MLTISLIQLTNSDFVYHFNSILTKGKKDNTYKFALARFLLDYSYGLDDKYIENKINDNSYEEIEFSKIAKSFLKYYWHQICKYKIKQNYNLEKLPLVVQIITDVFGNEYIPDSFEKMEREKIVYAEKMITKKCFLEVIPRFQNMPEGNRIRSTNVFYEYNTKSISLKPQAALFFKENYSFLSKSVIMEWAKFLEKINHGLPRLISKIESEEFKRGSLSKYRTILQKYFDKCFYCNNPLSQETYSIHVDHFIPWSYIYEDELWNLVLACDRCNCDKSDSLIEPQVENIKKLVQRNLDYRVKIEELEKSIKRLEGKYTQEKAIEKYYQNCLDYGFTKVTLNIDDKSFNDAS